MPFNLSDRPIATRILALVLGVFGSMLGLYLAVHVVGAIFRAAFGVPKGFNEDYATKEAWLQARLVEALTVSAIFLAIGAFLKFVTNKRPFILAVWASNPLSIAFGYWLFQRLWSGDGPGEYFGLTGLVFFALIGPFLFVLSFLLGSRISGLSKIGNVAHP